MTKIEFEAYLNDQTKEVTPVMFFYYKLSGGHLSEYYFVHAFMEWVTLIGARRLAQVHYHVFKELNKHFKI